MKKNIFFDARMWAHPGIGRYIRELAGELVREPRHTLTFLMRPEARDSAQKILGVSDTIRFAEAHSGIYSAAEQMEILRLARGADLLHVPHFNIPIFYTGKLVTTVHDLIYLHEPASAGKPFLAKLYAKTLLGAVCRKSAAIIAVSEYTKKEILESFRSVSAEKIHVIHEAAFADSPLSGAPPVDAKKQFLLEKPFVLFVGTQKPHKNLETLIEAAGRAREKGLEHELVVVGKKDPSNLRVADLIRRHSFVRELGEVNDEELTGLYRAADLLCLPSFREGFGLPVLEAMACGTPVAVSNRASLPEVAGSAGALFDPGRIDALSELLYNVLRNPELRQNMSRMGLEQSKKFSWKKAAARTWEVYERVLA